MGIPPASWPPWDHGPAIPTWRPDLLPATRRRVPDVTFLPTPPGIVATMLEMAEIRADDVLYDLGCGDGRIPIAAKLHGIRAVGIDVDRARLREAGSLAEANGVGHLVTWREGDVFREDLAGRPS